MLKYPRPNHYAIYNGRTFSSRIRFLIGAIYLSAVGLLDKFRCVTVSGWFGWIVTSMIWSVIIMIACFALPKSLGGPIKFSTHAAAGIFGFCVFINMLVTVFGDNERCQKNGYWSGWGSGRPWGQKFSLDAQGMRHNQPWKSPAPASVPMAKPVPGPVGEPELNGM